MISKPRAILGLAGLASRVLGRDRSTRLTESFIYRFGNRFAGDKILVLAENLRHVDPTLDAETSHQLALESLASYARYWAETLALPTCSSDEIASRFEVDGYEHIENAIAAGYGPILALPHLGGWEWGAAWLDSVAKQKVTAVVERLEPDDVFQWFKKHREAYGIEVLPLQSDTFTHLSRAVADKKVICLLCDRNISQTGMPVSFFGKTAYVPSGPALLSYRTGAPILPTAVYFDGSGIRTVVKPPLYADKGLSMKDSVSDLTQRTTDQLSELIAHDPVQWHVLERIWE